MVMKKEVTKGTVVKQIYYGESINYAYVMVIKKEVTKETVVKQIYYGCKLIICSKSLSFQMVPHNSFLK